MSEQKHPYPEFETTTLWAIVEKCITDLEDNSDVNITTRREYIIGYICKALSENGVHLEDGLR
jgi:hypothetical protein